MQTERTERRIDGSIVVMRVGAVLCALFASLGIASGIHEANPAAGWLIPAIAGVVAAATFAGVWHVLIGAVTLMVRLPVIIGTFVIGFALTLIALGASAQAIATAVSGRSAMSAELAENVDGFSQALGKAYGEATQWAALPLAARAKATGLKLQADMEASGANGKGSGQGPRYASLINIANVFNAGANALDEELAKAVRIRETGDLSVEALRTAATSGDMPAFMAGINGASAAITQLNAVDPRSVMHSFGAITASEKGIDFTNETAEFQAEADRALEGREQIDVPAFVPFSVGEATRRQAFSAALHGWILAGAIDVLPLLCLFLAFAMSREVGHQQQIIRHKLTPVGRADRDRTNLKVIRPGNDDNEISTYKAAAE